MNEERVLTDFGLVAPEMARLIERLDRISGHEETAVIWRWGGEQYEAGRRRADSLDAAWAEVVNALGPTQRIVLWAEKDGPQYAQVLAPSEPTCEHDEDTMRPVLTRLAAYPSKGLGNLVAELRALAATLREAAP